jgi:hypothetical protein
VFRVKGVEGSDSMVGGEVCFQQCIPQQFECVWCQGIVMI